MSPIVDVDGHPYPGARRRRLLASRWWRLRFAVVILLTYIGMQATVMIFTAREKRIALEAIATVDAKLDEAKKTIDAQRGGNVVSFSGISTGYVSFQANSMLDTPLRPASQEQERLLTRALDLWEKALGGPLTIPRPILMVGEPETCEIRYAVACANAGQITLSSARPCKDPACDLETILMHEVGHLLGVPHIQGDRLMDADYQGKLSKPTEQAIALARLHTRVK